MGRGRALDPIDLLVCANLIAQGMDQSEVAAQLGLSPATVSRLVKRALKTRRLRSEILYKFIQDDLPKHIIDTIAIRSRPNPSTLLLDRLARLSASNTLQSLNIVQSGSRGTQPEDWDRRLRQFAIGVAPIIGDYLKDAEAVGVAWGDTIAAVIGGLRDLGIVSSRPGKATRCFPVTGETLDLTGSNRTASSLASDLSEIVNNRPLEEQFSLLGVPAVIPARFRGPKLKLIKEFLSDNHRYRAIFGTRSRLVDKMDCLITSVGDATQASSFWNERFTRSYLGDSATDREHASHLTEKLRRLTVGDVAGALIPIDEQSTKDVEYGELLQHWCGIRLEQIINCAKRGASSPNCPGVIIAAIGSNKVNVVCESVRRGYVNRLLIDHSLADALSDKLTAHPSN